MMTKGMHESKSKEIIIKSVKQDTWELVFQFLYMGTIVLEEEEIAIEILRFAHQYEIPVLLVRAEKYQAVIFQFKGLTIM